MGGKSYDAVVATVFLIALLSLFPVMSCTKKTTEPENHHGKGRVEWEKTFGGSSYEYGFSVLQTSDGGYIIAGTTYLLRAYETDVYLIKTDINGDTLWTKTYGENDIDEANSIQQTSDGGYIIAGYTSALYGLGWSDVYLIKTDPSGSIHWTKALGRDSSDVGVSVQQTDDNGYIITGWTNSFFSDDKDVYLIKTDANGDTLWTKIYGGAEDDKGFSVQQTSEGGFIIVGYKKSYSDADIYLIKTDENGDAIWTKTYGSYKYDCGYSVQQTTDGGYIIAGTTESFGAGEKDAYLIKTDENGDILWTKACGGINEEEAYSVKQTSDGGYIVAGWTNSFGEGWEDVYIISADANGDILWTKTYGGTLRDFSRSIQQTSDGGYIIGGYTNSFGAGYYDVYLLKIEP